MLLLGFEDADYEAIMQGNFMRNVADTFFNNNKVVKMAGNSIVVPVLEEVFKQMDYIDEHLLVKASVSQMTETPQLIGDLSFATQ